MNWLSIAVVVFLILMAAFGAKRGLVRMIMSFAAALLALGIVALIDQPLEQAIREHTLLEETIENTVRSYVEESIQSAAGSTAVRVQKTIDNLMLPETLKASLREGNTPENYMNMGVKDASDYVVKWLSSLVFSVIVYICAFILVRIGLWLATLVLDSLVRLPVLRQLNMLAGGAIGILLAVLLLWIGGLAATAAAATGWGSEVCARIAESTFLTWLNDQNILIRGVLNKSVTV